MCSIQLLSIRLSFDSKLQMWHVKRSLPIVLCCRVEGVQRYATCHKSRCVCEGCSSRHPWAEALMVCVVASSRWNVNLLQFLLSAALCSIAASLHTPCLAWAHFPCMPCLPVLISTPPFFFYYIFHFFNDTSFWQLSSTCCVRESFSSDAQPSEAPPGAGRKHCWHLLQAADLRLEGVSSRLMLTCCSLLLGGRW